MEPEDAALLPWQVRAWRRPSFRWATALTAAAALCGALAALWSWGQRQDARRAEVASDMSDAEDGEASTAGALPSSEGLFTRLGAPRAGSWRAEHPQPRQTLVGYMSQEPNRPTDARSTIYLRAVGPWPADSTEMNTLRDFAAAYFQVPVKIGEPMVAPDVRERTNTNTSALQWRSDDLLEVLQRDLPDDAFCVLGVTHVDLWPGDGWNFVFGQASLRGRAGIFSFARHDDAFFGAPPTPPDQRRRRDLRVMTHEIGHMFTMEHCQAYECNMNGSNSLAESDRQPLHLCPVCAEKLRHATPFDPIERHEELGRLYERHSLDDEAGWTRSRIENLRGAAAR